MLAMCSALCKLCEMRVGGSYQSMLSRLEYSLTQGKQEVSAHWHQAVVHWRDRCAWQSRSSPPRSKCRMAAAAAALYPSRGADQARPAANPHPICEQCWVSFLLSGLRTSESALHATFVQ